VSCDDFFFVRHKETNSMNDKYLWLLYVALAGLAWGTYVPIIFYGGNELSAKPGPSGRFMAILCVGIAYFVIGVILPLVMFATNWAGVKWGDVNLKASGVTFASLAGVAGAVGAICVIFATTAAMSAAREANLPKETYKVYIAPLIFSLAPIINVLVSMIWHPKPDQPFHFELEVPGWKLWVGIVLVGIGAALVLFSKEEAEGTKASAGQPAVAVASEAPQVIPEAKP
jgi:hypothetical protein